MLSQIGVGQQLWMPQAWKPCTAITLVVGMVRSSGGACCLLLASAALHTGTASSKRTSKGCLTRMCKGVFREAQGWSMLANTVGYAPASGETPNSSDMGRLGLMPVQMQRCPGDDPFEGNFLVRSSGPPWLPPPDVWTRILTSTYGEHETRVTEALMHH
jgi:hypothetical protein